MIEKWIEHRRGDGERLGWIRPDGDGFHVIDLLGRQRTDAVVDWLEAEETLENLGIGYLADQYLLLVEHEERRVRITESSESRIVVVADDYGDAAAIGANPETFILPFPAPDRLRPID